MPARGASNTDTTCRPPSSRVPPSTPGQCAGCRHPRLRRWSSNRFGIISDPCSRSTTEALSILTLHALRSSRTDWLSSLPSHQALLRSLGRRLRQDGAVRFSCPRGSVLSKRVRYVRRRGRDWWHQLPVAAVGLINSSLIQQRVPTASPSEKNAARERST